jgi:hypothetical protein
MKTNLFAISPIKAIKLFQNKNCICNRVKLIFANYKNFLQLNARKFTQFSANLCTQELFNDNWMTLAMSLEQNIEHIM